MSAEQCAIIAEMSADMTYNIAIFIKCIICLGGAVLLSRQWITHGVQFLVHKNSQTLFHFYYGINFLLGLDFGLAYLMDLVRYSFPIATIKPTNEAVCRGIGISAVFSAHHILVLLSLERLYSSLFPSIFEKYSSRSLAITLAVIAIFLSTSYVIWNLTDNFRLFYEHYVAILDIKTRENTVRYLQAMHVLTISTVISLLIFFVDVYLIFYRRSTTDTSLAVTYQFSENRRVILTLLPIEIFDAGFTIVTTVAQLLYAKFAPNSSPVSRQLFLELTTFAVTYPLALAIIIEWRVKRRRQLILPIDSEIDHFKNLQTFWE